jgi:hypothetical protein
MPTCKPKPNRTSPRYFTAADVARCAEYALQSDSKYAILAAVIVRLELESAVFIWDCCPTCSPDDGTSSDTIDDRTKGEKAIGNASKAVERISRLPFGRSPIVRAVLKIIEVSLDELSEYLFTSPGDSDMSPECIARLGEHLLLQGLAEWNGITGED